MTRRRFFAAPVAFDQTNKTVVLDTAEARHLRDVLRLREGDETFVFDGEGREFRCVVRDATAKAARLEIVEPVEPPSAESPIRLTLAMALLKGEKFDLVVQKATELGVVRIVPVLTARSDIKLTGVNAGAKRVERWNRLAMEAAKQCGRAFVPACDEPLEFSKLIGDQRFGETRLMFTERDGDGFDMIAAATNLIALVGPEGGWADEELEAARASGWTLITLGGRTLRAETAAITVVALLQNHFGDLK